MTPTPDRACAACARRALSSREGQVLSEGERKPASAGPYLVFSAPQPALERSTSLRGLRRVPVLAALLHVRQWIPEGSGVARRAAGCGACEPLPIGTEAHLLGTGEAARLPFVRARRVQLGRDLTGFGHVRNGVTERRRVARRAAGDDLVLVFAAFAETHALRAGDGASAVLVAAKLPSFGR